MRSIVASSKPLLDPGADLGVGVRGMLDPRERHVAKKCRGRQDDVEPSDVPALGCPGPELDDDPAFRAVCASPDGFDPRLAGDLHADQFEVRE
jgi:hypothetical protein